MVEMVKMMAIAEVVAVAVHLPLAQLELQAEMVALELHQVLLDHQ